MMVEFTPQIVLSGLQTAGLLIGILYYIMDLQNQREDQKLANARQELKLKSQEQALETRQAELFMQIFQTYNSVEYALQRFAVYDMQWDDLEDFNRKYRDVPNEDLTVYSSYIAMGRFFDGLWVLLQENLMDKKLVYQLYISDVIRWWEMFKPRFDEFKAIGISHGFDRARAQNKDLERYSSHR